MSNMYSYNNMPYIKHARSIQDLSHGHSTTFNVGELVPVDIQEILPGDTMKVFSTFVCRTSSPLVRPVLGNFFLDVFYFWCPNRYVYDNFERIFGDTQGLNSYQSPVDYYAPCIGDSGSFVAASQTVQKGSIAQHFGIPAGYKADGSVNSFINVLPFRHLANVWNNWFRNQNVEIPMNIQKGVWQSTYELLSQSGGARAWSAPNSYCGSLPPVCKIGDYFTRALPAPQKGAAVPLASGSAGFVPLKVGNTMTALGGSMMVGTFDSQGAAGSIPLGVGTGGSDTYNHVGFMDETNPSGASINNTVTSTNLGVNVNLSSITINDVRRSFALQSILEEAARYGTRYFEFVRGAFGVAVPQSELQIPEYLGGKRIPINFEQVVNTGGGVGYTLAETAAFSLSNGQTGYSKSFTQHGFVLTLACVRQMHVYASGVEKFWNRRGRFDYYQPNLAHLGEQPIKNREINGLATSGLDNTFGWQEAWADYRIRPNVVSGDLASVGSGSLGSLWSLHDNFGTTAPTLSAGFVHETPDNLDRVLTIKSTTQNQIILDCWHKVRAVRAMPVYSVPKLEG